MIRFTAKVEQGKIVIPEEYLGRVGEDVIEVTIKPKSSRLLDRLTEQPLVAPGWRDLSREEIHKRFDENPLVSFRNGRGCGGFGHVDANLGNED